MKKILPIIIMLLAVGGGSFYGGMKYAESTRQNFARRNLSGQEFGANTGGFRGGAGSGQRGGGGFTAGEIISKDDKSITVKLQGGGSKIIFFSGSTEITKSVSGAIDDLEIGKNITANGTANSDGSITAQMLQIRPVLNQRPGQ